MIDIKTDQEIDAMRKGGKMLHEILAKVSEKVAPGVSTLELNEYAEKLMDEMGVESSFKGYKGFPAVLCTSVNDEVVHGIPTERRLEEGDIIGIDCGIWHKGLCTDHAVTLPVGKVDNEISFFLQTVQKALKKALNIIKPGCTTGDIGNIIQKTVEKRGYSPVRDCVGHGVGKDLHEPPDVPNYGKPGKGPELKAGMTLAIEPIVNMGHYENYVKDDGWTVTSRDGSPSAQFEHTIVVTENGCEVLT